MRLSTLFASMIIISSCSIYRSPDRKEFESESPQFKAQNLKLKSCSNQSLRSQATQSRLITFLEETSLWEHIITEQSYFESANLKNGEYCIYE